MANPTPVEPEAPRAWYAGLVGFIFAVLVLGSVGLATAASYDNNSDDDHGGEHADEDADHGDDDDHSDEDADHSDDDHGDDDDHSDEDS